MWTSSAVRASNVHFVSGSMKSVLQAPPVFAASASHQCTYHDIGSAPSSPCSAPSSLSALDGSSDCGASASVQALARKCHHYQQLLGAMHRHRGHLRQRALLIEIMELWHRAAKNLAAGRRHGAKEQGSCRFRLQDQREAQAWHDWSRYHEHDAWHQNRYQQWHSHRARHHQHNSKVVIIIRQ